MYIEREIGGVMRKLELTNSELYRAFEEQQFLYDRSDMEDYIDQCTGYGEMTDAEFKGEYGITIDEARENVDSMAVEMRRLIYKYDNDWDYARGEAFTTIVEEIKSERSKQEVIA